MAKPGTMPSKDVIDGFKGKLDFYYWKGIPVARSWPVFKPYKFSAAQLANQAAFRYVNKLWASLAISIKVALSLLVSQTTLTAKDLYVRSYMKGAFALMPPEYYATEATQLALLAQLDVALSTRALEAGGNLAAILAQLDVALSTRALEAGGNLAAVDARLDAIQITRGSLAYASREGPLASGLGWTTVLTIAAKGVLVGLDVSSDFKSTEWDLVLDGNSLGLPTPTGSNIFFSSFLRLNDLAGLSTFFQQGVYDATNDYYSIFLKRQLHYDASLIVRCRHVAGVNKNVAVAAYYQPET